MDLGTIFAGNEVTIQSTKRKRVSLIKNKHAYTISNLNSKYHEKN
jgi:hypothetical protein